MFILLLTRLVNASSHTKSISLCNQKCEIQPTIIKLYSNGYSKELHYFPFAIKLDKCVGNCNILNEFSNKECAPNKNRRFKYTCF